MTTKETSPAPVDAAAFPVTDERDPEAVTRRMVDRMFKTKNIDEMFDALSGTSSDELVGKTIEVKSVEWDVYESDKGPIPLAVVGAVDQTDGELFEFVTTSPMLTSFIRQAEVLSLIPFKARIEGKKTRSGREALNFVRP